MGDNMSILNEENGVYSHTVKETEETTEIEPIKIDWKRKLSSRKFWMAVALFVSGVFTFLGRKETGEAIAGLIMQAAAVVTYIVAEGWTDVANSDYGIEYDVEEGE